jgi:hypothetical protein
LLSFKNISRAIIFKKIEKDSRCLGFFYNSLNKKVKAFAKSSKTALSLKIVIILLIMALHQDSEIFRKAVENNPYDNAGASMTFLFFYCNEITPLRGFISLQ